MTHASPPTEPRSISDTALALLVRKYGTAPQAGADEQTFLALRELLHLRAEAALQPSGASDQQVAEAVAVEREACAKLCEILGDEKQGHSSGWRSAAWTCRDLIRGRGANRA